MNHMVQQGYLQLAHQSGTDPLLLLYQHSNSWDRQLINNLTYQARNGKWLSFAPPAAPRGVGEPTNPMHQPPVPLPLGAGLFRLTGHAVPDPGTYNPSAVAFDRALPGHGLERGGARDIYTGQPISTGLPVLTLKGAKAP